MIQKGCIQLLRIKQSSKSRSGDKQNRKVKARACLVLALIEACDLDADEHLKVVCAVASFASLNVYHDDECHLTIQHCVMLLQHLPGICKRSWAPSALLQGILPKISNRSLPETAKKTDCRVLQTKLWLEDRISDRATWGWQVAATI